MKKLVLLSIMLLGAFAISAQVIKGKFNNYQGETIKINIGGCDREALSIAEDGSFVFNPVIRYENQKFTINMPDEIRIPVLVGKGEEVRLEVSKDKNGETTVKFAGDRTDINTYLFAHANQLSGRRWAKGKTFNSFDEFSSSLDRLDKELDRMLNKIKGDRDLVEEYRVEKNVDVISCKIGYGKSDKKLTLDDPGYVKFMRSIDLNDSVTFRKDPRKASLGYPGLVERRISWEEKNRAKAGDDPSKSFIRKLLILDELVTNQEIKNNVSHFYAVMFYMGGGNAHAREFVDIFNRINTDPTHLAFVKSRPLPSEDNSLAAGSLAKDFEMHDRDGNLVKFSDLRGKLVYMDIWATWCGPCVEEIPHMEKLYQQYKDNPRVLFVSVSVDSKVDAWKKKLDEDKPEWPQYIVDGALKDKLYNEYMVVGIPRFMMFDQDGRIITINAMRPSNSNIVPFIEEQLAKPRKVQGLSGMKKIKLK